MTSLSEAIQSVQESLRLLESCRQPSLTFDDFSKVNRQRVERWHPSFPNDAWTGADWSNAMCGEAGETANVVKKLRRNELNLKSAVDPDRAVLLVKLAEEIADTFTYLDLLAQHYGIDLPAALAMKFNAVSVREGFPERILTSQSDSVAPPEEPVLEVEGYEWPWPDGLRVKHREPHLSGYVDGHRQTPEGVMVYVRQDGLGRSPGSHWVLSPSNLCGWSPV